MKFNMPMAVFGDLALIAAAIYFGSGSQPVNAAGGVQKIATFSMASAWMWAVASKPPGRKYRTARNAGIILKEGVNHEPI